VTVANICECELKRPIGVLRRKEPDEDGKRFDLVSGYGRLEGFTVLGETKIPAVVIETSPKKRAQRARGEVS
jgi:ParB family transcriptional regulator, chromosome partitioning protein